MRDADGWDPRLTEARNPRTRDIDRASPREIVEAIQEEDRRVPDAVSSEAAAIASVVEDVAARMREGGRLFYVGAGTSGRLGVLDAAECPPTFGTDPRRVQGIIAGGRRALVRSQEGAEDDRDAGCRAIREADVTASDFVLGIATSGTTPYVQAAVEEAAERGAGTGFLSCAEPPSAMREIADHLITPLVGPEVIAGSTRMKAGTATKLVLNTLSTAVMIRLGKVYGNLMVDLQAVSRKLVDRSLRILGAVCGLRGAEARRLLVRSGGSVKTAIAMDRLGANRAVAERLLDSVDGFLGEAVDRYAGVDPLPYYGCYPDALAGEARERLLERLAEGPERLRRAVAEREEWAGAEEERVGWSPPEHLGHLVEVELGAYRSRIEAVLGAPSGETLQFEDWLPSEHPPLADRAIGELVTRFREERRRTVALLEEADPEAWDRGIVVAEEEIRLHQLLRGMAHHDEAHAERIREWIHPALVSGGATGDGERVGSGPAAGPGGEDGGNAGSASRG